MYSECFQIAVAELMQNSSDWETFELSYNFATNLRPRVAQEVPVDYSGLYMSVVTLTAKIEKEATTSTEVFWKYAGIVYTHSMTNLYQ